MDVPERAGNGLAVFRGWLVFSLFTDIFGISVEIIEISGNLNAGLLSFLSYGKNNYGFFAFSGDFRLPQ